MQIVLLLVPLGLEGISYMLQLFYMMLVGFQNKNSNSSLLHPLFEATTALRDLRVCQCFNLTLFVLKEASCFCAGSISLCTRTQFSQYHGQYHHQLVFIPPDLLVLWVILPKMKFLVWGKKQLQ